MKKMNTKCLALLPAMGLKRCSVMRVSVVIRRAVRAVALLIPALLLPGVVEAQTTHTVGISPYDPFTYDGPHFHPPSLTIPVGDTVEWRTLRPSQHNITWLAEEFPTSSSFPYSHTFDSPGEFRYRCTVHNRSGTITVTGPAADFDINAGLNDVWKNPDTPGQGFFINVFPDTGQVFLAWFTYDTERPADSATANIGEPGHRWLTAFGHYADNQAVLDIEITEGGVFNAANPAPSQHLDGTVWLEFSNCNAATVLYDLPSIGRSGSIPIRGFPATTCLRVRCWLTCPRLDLLRRSRPQARLQTGAVTALQPLVPSSTAALTMPGKTRPLPGRAFSSTCFRILERCSWPGLPTILRAHLGPSMRTSVIRAIAG